MCVYYVIFAEIKLFYCIISYEWRAVVILLFEDDASKFIMSDLE